MDRLFDALGRPGRLLQDFLNGTWLGHTVHATLVDVVVGAATAALLLDVLRVVFGVPGLEDATTWIVGLTWLSAVAAIVTGLTDFKDTNHDTAARDVTGLHGIINIVGTGGFALSFFQRLNGSHDAAFWALLIGYLIITVGAYIGGHVVYKHGYMVSFNAHARGRRAADFTPVMDAAELPDGVATKANFGTTAVMLVRRGEVVYALKETCSHLGGPLSKGELADDTITCPWHDSTSGCATAQSCMVRRHHASRPTPLASQTGRFRSKARTTDRQRRSPRPAASRRRGPRRAVPVCTRRLYGRASDRRSPRWAVPVCTRRLYGRTSGRRRAVGRRAMHRVTEPAEGAPRGPIPASRSTARSPIESSRE